MILKLKDGNVEIELFDKIAPKHVDRIKKLAGKANMIMLFSPCNRWFHGTNRRCSVCNTSNSDFNLDRAGMGGSNLPDLDAKFSDLPHLRGTLSMARSSDPNSANSQFFICFDDVHLDRNYTVFGKVTKE